MKSLLQQFLKLFTIAAELFRKGERKASKWLRIILLLVVAQFVLVVASSMLPYHTATTVVPLVALIPIIALIAIACAHPIIVTALAAIVIKTESGNDFFRPLYKIIGFELVMGIWFAVVPVSRDRQLIPLVILTFVCFLFFRSGFIKFGLVCTVIVLTLIFVWGGRKAVAKTFNDQINTSNDKGDGKDTDKAPKKSEPTARIVNTLPEAPKATQEYVAPIEPLTPQTPVPLCMEYKPGEEEMSAATRNYGDGDEFVVRMSTCHPDGNRVSFSGSLTYNGDNPKFSVYFHPFTVQDSTGGRYDVQGGSLNEESGLGTGHSSAKMPPGTTVNFTFTVIRHNGFPVSAPYMTVVMPFNDSLGRQIDFQKLILR